MLPDADCCVFFHLLSPAIVIIPFAPVILMSLVVSDSVSEFRLSRKDAELNPETQIQSLKSAL